MPKVYDLYMEDLGPLKAMTVLMAFLGASVMFFQGNLIDLNENLTYLVTIFSKWLWAALFIVFAILRSINVRINKNFWYIDLLNSVLGIWLWSLLLVSATVMTPIGGIDLMLIIPLVCELWIMSRTVGRKMGI